MAHLIPKINVDKIPLKPERDVAAVLVEQLPNNVWVFHSYPWLRADRNDRTGKVTLHEGEADFLILWPELGLLVLEVKGGEIQYESATRRWYRALGEGRERDIKDPFEQARNNIHEVIRRVKFNYGGGNPKFAFGYSVVFPDCIYSGEMPPGAESAIVLSADDLSKMQKQIAKALRQWSRIDPPYLIEKNELEGIKQAILPQFNIVPVLFRTIEEQEEKLFRMTEEQVRLLEFLGQNTRAAIEGVAGSGKTMLAKAQAHRFAKDGKRTLLLCYNRFLAQWLRDAVPEKYSDLIHVYHFHGLCSEWCKKSNTVFKPPTTNEEEFWQHEAAELLWESIDVLPDECFDAVVIDEAQDFYVDWWDPIELMNNGGGSGSMYVFYDPAQNLYNKEGISIPNLGEPFHLPTNCRNTCEIVSTCSDIIHQQISTHPLAPKGIETEIIEESDAAKVYTLLTSMVKTWVKKERITPSQIVILSPFKKKNSCVAARNQFSGVTVTEDINAWRSDQGILFSTIRSFKGLEADIVVIIDVIQPDSLSNFTKSDFYVACSRAKHVLKVITSVSPEMLLNNNDTQMETVVDE